MKHTRENENQMTIFFRILSVILAPMVALILGAAVSKSWALPLADAKIYFEYNSTDLDLGIHIFTDGEAWVDFQVTGPDGPIFNAFNSGELNLIGSTELFTESDEPDLTEECADPEDCTDTEIENAISDFQEGFPEGQYVFSVTTIEDQNLVGRWRLSHSLPAPPVINSPEEDGTLDPNDAVIMWEPGEGGATVVRWEVVVEFEQNGTEETYTATYQVPAAAESLTVAPEFFDSLSGMQGEYKVEVIGIAANRNATITEHEFELED